MPQRDAGEMDAPARVKSNVRAMEAAEATAASAQEVLVVDDEPAVRALLEGLLAEEGYDVRCAGDGLAALAAVDRLCPDLVVADVMMPRLDGLGLLARLRERGDRTPFVFDSAARSVPPAAGVAFVAKPFDLDCVLAAVASALAR